jgi:hypothetical protein
MAAAVSDAVMRLPLPVDRESREEAPPRATRRIPEHDIRGHRHGAAVAGALRGPAPDRLGNEVHAPVANRMGKCSSRGGDGIRRPVGDQVLMAKSPKPRCLTLCWNSALSARVTRGLQVTRILPPWPSRMRPVKSANSASST